MSGIDADRQLVGNAVNSVAARVVARQGGTPPSAGGLQSEVIAPPFPPRFEGVLNGIDADRQLVGNAVNSVAAGAAGRSLPPAAPVAAAPVVAAAQRVPVATGTVLADPWGDFGTVPVLQRRPDQDSSAAHPTALQAVADLASNGLDLIEPPSIAARGTAARGTAARGTAAKSVGGPVLELSNTYIPRPAPAAGPVLEVGPGTAAGVAEELANVSGGGAGTSTAKGAAATARQVAKRGLLQEFDEFLTNPAHGVGVASEQGLRNTSAYLLRNKMPGLAGMAKNLAPVARWAAPAAAVGTAVGLPAITGAMEGNDKAGAGGAVLQGGGALAGALIGQTLIPVPFVGAAVGSMIGNAVGGGLAGGAAGLVEKAQAGDSGWAGGIGRALDPFVDTAFEKQQQAAMQQMNSPAMRMIRDQETARVEQARADQAHAVLMQAYLQQIR